MLAACLGSDGRACPALTAACARRYVQLEARAALHMKATLVAQAARSAYRQVEARLGARLSRQDLGVEQARACLRGASCIVRLWCVCPLEEVSLASCGAMYARKKCMHGSASSARRSELQHGLCSSPLGQWGARRQGGKATETGLRSFLLAGEAQLHDLHSKLRMQHPAGSAEQLHKCALPTSRQACRWPACCDTVCLQAIVECAPLRTCCNTLWHRCTCPASKNGRVRRCIVAAASGRGVFDGNVRVERLAQKTDAAQLSRNLLLVPRATVNVKPNLQIVADDVKCTHGAAISDLEETQLFYLQCAPHGGLVQAWQVLQRAPYG